MHLIDRSRTASADPRLAAMFRARKQVFVDLLGWDVPVVDDLYEIDQFDDSHATYLVLTRPDGAHLASARLLPTVRPHILDTLFPQLCAGPLPRGPGVVEITRFCLDRASRSSDRRLHRNQLVSALADHAIEAEIRTYVGVAEVGWLQQILAFGWRCMPLGLPMKIGGRMLGALRIDIDGETRDRLSAAGTYVARAPGAAQLLPA